MIPFNRPHLFGNELQYITDAVKSGKISGDGIFTQKCHEFFEQQFGFRRVLLTSSCTDAIEMISLLSNIKEGDEIIAPSFTFVSTVNPFVMRGANIVFCDVRNDVPCIDESKIESLISLRTRAIVVMHYAGIACNMDEILKIANKHNLLVIEDAAQAVNASYNNTPLGSFGSFSAFSFHETKNVMAGEGGMIVLNNDQYIERAEIIREKGTDRSKFFRGEVNKYQWVDIGSSFLPSEITAAFLYAQLEHLDDISKKRHQLWNTYYSELSPLQNEGKLKLPQIPAYAQHNAHIFYIVTENPEDRTRLMQHLSDKGIMAIFHYQPLHSSNFWHSRYSGPRLENTDRFAETLLRLPLYYSLSQSEVKMIASEAKNFYNGR